jgi:predicted acyl esterase
MMHSLTTRFFTCALGVSVLVLLAAGSAQAAEQPVFPQRGAVSAPMYSSYERNAYYVPMSDGVRLAVTVYTPSNGPVAERFPVLLWYMPGHRESIDLANGRIVSAYPEQELRFFTSHGYALAVAEMRGSGASFGFRELDRGPQIGRDGKQLVDWLAAQPWCAGVGMVGSSYQGFSQYATAAEQPVALKAIFPEIAGFDDYTSMFYPGGIANVALSAFASASIARDDLNYYQPAEARARLPSVPVIDEDGDGDLVDEIPVDKDGNGTFLNDGEPTYSDGQSRQHLYYNATREHLRNANLGVDAIMAAPFRDSRLGGTTYSYLDIDPGQRPQRIAAAGIAVYNRGGWFDYHARDTVMWHATLSGHTPTHLMMAPTGHGGFPGDIEEIYRAGPYFKLFGDIATRATLNNEKLRFFDYYLRGINNDFDKTPPVLIYVMGGGWRAEQEWPLKRQVASDFYFGEAGELSRSPGPRGSDRYQVDLAADSRSHGANRWNYGISAASEPMDFTESDRKRKSYTTAPLTTDMEVTGHPLLTLQLSSDAANADIFVYLEDVAPDGQVLLVSEGQLRANYPQQRPIQEILGGVQHALTVRPELPWHGYRSGDFVADVLRDGQPRTFTLDLMPTSWLFKTRHRIRVSLAGADAPSFPLHPSLAAGGNQSPIWMIFRGESASRITLPVIPAQR